MRKRLTAGLLAGLALTLVGCADGVGGEHEVVYTISSDGSSATSISYVTVSGADVSLDQASDEALPWSRTVTIPNGAFSNSILNLAGRLGEDGTTITCDISVDGTSIASQTSTGQSAAVTCSGSQEPSSEQ